MKKKCKILFGLEAADSGALKHLVYLVSKLNRKYFSVTVILSQKRSERVYETVSTMQAAGTRVIIMSMERAINPWKDLRGVVALVRHMRNEKYDVVHAHSSKAGILFRMAAWLTGVKNICYTPHCFYFQSKTGLQQRLYAGIERLMGRMTDHIVVSNSEKNAALKFAVAREGKLMSINNAINFRDYTPWLREDAGKNKIALRQELGINAGDIVIGAVGRLTRQKDWETYIHAAAETTRQHPNAAFLIVGEGELKADLQQRINSLGLEKKVIITGYRNDIDHIYDIIDIYVSTSLWEGLPYVILEAMWFRKPVIATDLDYGDIIRDEENGYLVSCRDYRLIADKISCLIQNNTLSKHMGQRGFMMAKKYVSFKKFVCKHEELYLQNKAFFPFKGSL